LIIGRIVRAPQLNQDTHTAPVIGIYSKNEADYCAQFDLPPNYFLHYKMVALSVLHGGTQSKIQMRGNGSSAVYYMQCLWVLSAVGQKLVEYSAK
jgi:hypothetical protein